MAEVNLESDPYYKKADVNERKFRTSEYGNTYKNLDKANITYTFGDETVTLDGNTIKTGCSLTRKGSCSRMMKPSGST